MSALLNTAVSAAYAAGEIILRNIQRLDSIKISEKGKNEFVSEVDQKAEEKILSIISKKYPNDSVLAEESGLSKASSDNQWLIDPLDGTTNYIHSFPHYAVSIALQKDKELILGVVYDPFKQELFTAEKGQGALLNNHKIRVSQRTNIDKHVPYKGNRLLVFNAALPHKAMPVSRECYELRTCVVFKVLIHGGTGASTVSYTHLTLPTNREV